MEVDLETKIGNGYLYGTVFTSEGSYELNIQEGTDNHSIFPIGLHVPDGPCQLYFNTGNRNRIPIDSVIKKAETDMIQLFVDIANLVELTKDPPISMEIRTI